MSSSLHWKPIAPEGKPLADQLKFRLRARFGMSSHHDPIYLDRGNVDYLNGLADGLDGDSKKDARGLITAIEKHGEIMVWEAN